MEIVLLVYHHVMQEMLGVYPVTVGLLLPDLHHQHHLHEVKEMVDYQLLRDVNEKNN